MGVCSHGLEFQAQLEQILASPVKLVPLQELVAPTRNDIRDGEQQDSNNQSVGTYSRDDESKDGCPFDCCKKNLEKLYFSECELTNTSVKMRIGLDNFSHNNNNQNSVKLNMNFRQGRSNSFGAASSFSSMQKRTLFEGKVPGPRRFDELIRESREKMGPSEGDQEILLMERDNLKLTFHKGTVGSHAQGPQNTFQRDRFPYATGQLQPFYQVPTITDAGNAEKREDSTHWIHNFNKDMGSNSNNLKLKSDKDNKRTTIWCNGQMEVTKTTNVHSNPNNAAGLQRGGNTFSQNYSPDCKIPVMEMTPYGTSTQSANNTTAMMSQQRTDTSEFIDQQLNNHLKAFKYIKSNQQHQQQPPMLNQHYQTPPPPVSQPHMISQRHPNPLVTAATITKISYPTTNIPQNMHSLGTEGSGNNKAIMAALNSKSKPTFKQKSHVPTASAKAALEHYEKLRKYWEYQNQFLTQYGTDEHAHSYNQYTSPNSNMNHVGGQMFFGNSSEPGKSHLSINTYHQPQLQPPHASTPTWQQSLSSLNSYRENQGHAQKPHPGYDIRYSTSQPHLFKSHGQPQAKIQMYPNATMPYHLNPNTMPTKTGFSTSTEIDKLYKYQNISHGQGQGQIKMQENQWNYSNPKLGHVNFHKQLLGPVGPPQPPVNFAYSKHFAVGNGAVSQTQVPKMTNMSDANQTETCQSQKWHSMPIITTEGDTEEMQKNCGSVVQHEKPRAVASESKEALKCETSPNSRESFNEHPNQLSPPPPISQKIIIPLDENKDSQPSVPTSPPTVDNDDDEVQELPLDKDTPTDLSLPRRRSDQDQQLLMHRRLTNGSPQRDISNRSKSESVITDVSGYDHIVLLDKRVRTFMCKRCLETLKSDQDIHNHLFCKMLQNSIQCHVCRCLFATEEYAEHLRGHGVRAISN